MTRHGIARMLEMNPAPLPAAYSSLGEGMEAGFAANGKVPPLQDIAQQWQTLHANFQQKLASVPQSVLDRPSPFPVPGTTNSTIADLITILSNHEAYHIGQLGLQLKAATGKAVMSRD
jgi:uncharacterized damage-inducible protein DinB